ncbi:LysR family transcriptional regulator [Labrenzia sp. DG1229]|uniref:LysR family transcriptional regulator n=1 Tax=Labrenzia sp. DG1229 TaxID=681847 RepID=UPI00155DB602|nr:LysR family transcriptional regulator [Labrenzia sp. DG1229]
MKEFLEIANCSSISAAARILNLPRATLSRRLSGLEADLGVRLLHRRTTRLTLTEAGEELRLRASKIVVDAEAAWSAVQRLDDTPRGLLRVSLTGAYFMQLFTDFLRDFPEVKLEVLSTTRHVDLIAEGVDVAMRIGPVRDQNLIAKQIRSDRLLAVATPEYLESNGVPETTADLTGHNCIVGFAGDWSPSSSWPLLNGGTIPVSGRLAANEPGLVKASVLEGQGIALLPSAVAAGELSAGLLVPVLPDLIGADIPVSLVHADREFIDPKVRIFVDRAAEVMLRKMPAPYPLETNWA